MRNQSLQVNRVRDVSGNGIQFCFAAEQDPVKY